MGHMKDEDYAVDSTIICNYIIVAITEPLI